MFYLFNTDQINLPDFFRSISEEEIEECCTSKVFHRGNDYFRSGSVEEAAFNADKLKLKTLVVGDSDYTVQISLQKGEVAGSCTCPYETVCKHIIASLLFAVDEKSEIDVDTNSKKLEPDISQNHSLCGPGWVSLDFAQSILPNAPSRTLASAFRNFGVYTRSSK